MAKRKSTVNLKSKPQQEFSDPRRRRPFDIFLIMDDAAERQAIAGVLAAMKLTVHEYMTGREFLLDYRTSKPGVVLAEFRLRDTDVTSVMQQLVKKKLDVPLVILASHVDSTNAIKASRTLHCDFVLKAGVEEKIADAVARAYAMWYDVDWDFVGIDLDDVEDGMSRLTERELEILQLVFEGKSSREISLHLDVSVKTIEAHRSRINDKLRADDLAALIRMDSALRDERSET